MFLVFKTNIFFNSPWKIHVFNQKTCNFFFFLFGSVKVFSWKKYVHMCSTVISYRWHSIECSSSSLEAKLKKRWGVLFPGKKELKSNCLIIDTLVIASESTNCFCFSSATISYFWKSNILFYVVENVKQNGCCFSGFF